LKNENISRKKVHFVGNVMIDSLVRYLVKINFSTILSSIFSFKMLPQEERNLGLGDKLIVPDFILSTFHRPSNVDDLNILKELILMLGSLEYPVIFPVHPRTRNNLELAGLLGYLPSNLILTEPLGYIDFLALIKNATLVITDSGGIQEETTFLGVQCLTVRNNTERPVTVDLGTNQLIGTDFNMVKNAARKVLSGKRKPGKIPELWDGKAADRIVDVIVKTKF
ncbi:MAG: UDP-N-acetylglucosamine 2-epimerase, partial [Bacteroidota bacterium]|nr:UDP-N-acetylglucosamine 2-epimerase [Bacteroidota bacterium]